MLRKIHYSTTCPEDLDCRIYFNVADAPVNKETPPELAEGDQPLRQPGEQRSGGIGRVSFVREAA